MKRYAAFRRAFLFLLSLFAWVYVDGWPPAAAQGICQGPIRVDTDVQSIIFNAFNRKAYTANRANGTVSVVDVMNPDIRSVVRTVPVMPQPIALLANPVNGKVYVGGTSFPPYVMTIDPDTYEATRVALPPGSATGARSFSFAVDTAQNRVWFANATGPTGDVSVIDSDSDEVLARFTVPYPGFDGGFASVPWTVAFNPQDNKAYVLGFSAGDTMRRALLTILDGTSFQAIQRFGPLSPAANSGYRGAALYNPLADKIYCALFSGEIVILDGASDEIRTTHSVSGFTFTLAFNPDRNVVYAANYESRAVYVIDGASDQIVATVSLNGPLGLAYNAATGKLYVLDIGQIGSERMVLIDGATDAVLESCPVPPFPLIIGDNDGALVAPDDVTGRTLFAILSQSQSSSLGVVLP